MADSTLVQFLGGTDNASPSGTTAADSNRRQTEAFFAGGAITLGDWVAFDLSRTGSDKALYVVQSPAAAGNGTVVGVALNTAAANGKVQVVISGYVAAANVTTGTAAGAAIALSGTAGRAVAASYVGDGSGAASIPLPGICGVALTLASGNVAEVMVYKTF